MEGKDFMTVLSLTKQLNDVRSKFVHGNLTVDFTPKQLMEELLRVKFPYARHLVSCLYNDSIIRKKIYKGKTILRFKDTNVHQEAVKNIVLPALLKKRESMASYMRKKTNKEKAVVPASAPVIVAPTTSVVVVHDPIEEAVALLKSRGYKVYAPKVEYILL